MATLACYSMFCRSYPLRPFPLLNLYLFLSFTKQSSTLAIMSAIMKLPWVWKVVSCSFYQLNGIFLIFHYHGTRRTEIALVLAITEVEDGKDGLCKVMNKLGIPPSTQAEAVLAKKKRPSKAESPPSERWQFEISSSPERVASSNWKSWAGIVRKRCVWCRGWSVCRNFHPSHCPKEG